MKHRAVIAMTLAAAIAVALVIPPLLAEPFPTDRLIEGVACGNDPTQTYTLYLPPGYNTEHPDRLWPVLLIFDPRGRSMLAAELFVDAARDYGWILMSSDNTRSDTTWDPNKKALEAMWPEVGQRYAADGRRIYATGFSGGAIVSYFLSRSTGGVAGIIGVGGRWPKDMPSEDLDFAHFGIAGSTDFNYGEMRKIDAMFAQRNIVHRLEIFEGGHRWMPPDLAREGIEWLEILAIRSGLRELDPALVEKLFSKNLSLAGQLEAEGRWLAALRRYRAIRSTFHSLVDLGAVQAKIVALEVDPRVVEAESHESRWDAFFAGYWADTLPSLFLLKDTSRTLTAQELITRLEVRSLLQKAEKKSYEGVVAQRLLNTLHTQSGFYLTRELAAEGRYREAAIALEVAIAIRDQGWHPWYDLACYRARSGQKKQALNALKRAVELGFDNLDYMTRDTDLDSLRNMKAYRRLANRLADQLGSGGGPNLQ